MAFNIIGNIQDSINGITGKARKFVFNSGEFDAKNERWSADIVELIEASDIEADNLLVTAVNTDDSTIRINTSFYTTITIENQGGTEGSGTVEWQIINSSSVVIYNGSTLSGVVAAHGSEDIVVAMNTPPTKGTYTIRAKMTDDDVWVNKVISVVNWIEILPASYAWDGLTEETVEIAVTTDPSLKFTYDNLPSWITIDIGEYIGAEWTSYLSTPVKWSDGVIIRLTPDTAVGYRSGTMRLLIDSVAMISIPLSQEALKELPSISLSATGFTATDKYCEVTYGSTSVPYYFTPNINHNAHFYLLKNGVIITALSFIDLLEDGVQYAGEFTLPTAAGYNEAYLIHITNP